MSWGIAETASELEKLKSESADYLHGLNSCGEIDYSIYSEAFDFYADLIEKAYRFSKNINVHCNDTISRQAAIDALAKFVPYAICDESTESYTNGLTDAYNLICQLPSAQPEIIRCKDCKYGSPNGRYGCRVYHYKKYETHDMKPDDFCSHAERKTDE